MSDFTVKCCGAEAITEATNINGINVNIKFYLMSTMIIKTIRMYQKYLEDDILESRFFCRTFCTSILMVTVGEALGSLSQNVLSLPNT